jgi:hypothetical protein
MARTTVRTIDPLLPSGASAPPCPDNRQYATRGGGVAKAQGPTVTAGPDLYENFAKIKSLTA